MAKIKGSEIFSKGWRKLKGRKLKGAKIKGRRNLKGLRYIDDQNRVKMASNLVAFLIKLGLMLPMTQKNVSREKYMLQILIHTKWYS